MFCYFGVFFRILTLGDFVLVFLLRFLLGDFGYGFGIFLAVFVLVFFSDYWLFNLKNTEKLTIPWGSWYL